MKTNRLMRFSIFVCAVACLSLCSKLCAAEGGYGNYAPGFFGDFGMGVAPTDRLTLRNDTYFYKAEIDQSLRSGNLLLDSDLELLANTTLLAYRPDVKLLGGEYFFGAVIPFLDVELESTISGVGSIRSTADASGLGDINFIPIALFWQSGNMHYSAYQVVVAPTGEYDVDEPLNVSLNYWSFNTNVCANYLNPKTGQDYALNLGYIYNTENEDTNYQTGQIVHLNFAINQFLSEAWAVGIHGSHHRQITGDSGSGAILGGFKAEATTAGLGVLWNTKIGDMNVSFVAKWLQELEVENQLEGDHYFASFVLRW